MTEQDRHWIAGLRAERVDVYRDIFETYTRALWEFASVSVPPDIAEDIVQDVLFDVWNRRMSLDVRDGFARYLFGAVRNKVSNYLRHERIVRQVEDAPGAADDMGFGPALPSPDETIIADDLSEALTVALTKLSEIQRATLTLRWTHEMSYEQIADALAISVVAARQHVSRAQRVIRPLLDRFLDHR